MEWSPYFIFSAIVHACMCFNYDLSFVEIISIGSADKYFGYSVLLQKGLNSSIIVGAPNSTSSYKSHESVEQPGAVYKCDISTSQSCQQYVIEDKGNTERRMSDNRYSYTDRKDGGLLGASVDGGENVGDPFFVCSPRWKNDRNDKYGQHYLANGICYEMKNSADITATGERHMPLLNAAKQGFTLDNVVKYYYAMGETGLSMHYLKDENKLLLGAPGVLGWRGTVLKISFVESNILPPQQRLIQQRSKRDIRPVLDAPNPVYIPSLKEDNYYFGYSISSGRFVVQYRDLWFIAGSPRAEDLYGMVLLFEFPMYDDSDLIIHKKLIGEQFGSYFGASVLGVATAGKEGNRTKVADLLVGAPTYSIDTWDEGCVYFYKQDGEGNLDNPKKIFGDKKIGARFGTAISAIGDINKDNYEDIAISAPYEDGNGAVYIFLGGKNGLNTQYSQRISAKLLKDSLRGFGFSLSKGLDIDNNSYNDLAIGAYKSGEVVIVKSRPVIKYFANLTSSVRELLIHTSTFKIMYCLNYTSPTDIVKHVDTRIVIAKDTRSVNSNDTIRDITIQMDKNFCDSQEIVMQGGNFDYTKPFTVEITYELLNPFQDEFCSNCSVVDPNDSKSTKLNIHFANGCGTDNVCRPNLKVTVNSENNSSSLTIGQLTTLRLNVKIENTGEPAYLCQLFMTLPDDAEILQISSKCELQDDRYLECLVSDVLQPDTSREMVFDFDIKNINPSDQKLFFNLTVQSRGGEVNQEDNEVTITIPLRLESNLEISGISYPDSIIFVNESNQIVAEIMEFGHEYVVKNLGPSPMAGIVANFYFPVEINDDKLSQKIAFDVYEPDVLINNQAVYCTTSYRAGFRTNKVTGGESDLEENISGDENRFKRSADFDSTNSIEFSAPGAFDLPANRTTFINCKSDNFTCMKVVCSSTEVLNKNQFMTAKFLVRAHIKALIQITGDKDIILLSSTAEASVLSKTNMYHVPTLLIGSLSKTEISYWIYIGCVGAALVILFIIILILYKLNFFNRPVREKLHNEVDDEGEAKDLGIDNLGDEEISNL